MSISSAGGGGRFEDAAAGRAAKIEGRRAVAEVVGGPAGRVGRRLRVEQAEELLVAGVLAHRLGDRKVHRGLFPGEGSDQKDQRCSSRGGPRAPPHLIRLMSRGGNEN